ncbi:MAG TPA: DUF5132 domain-containing protein [Methylococcaceae bacterium]|nr:DUF5132 domain-containing protein [Methylococcaceae bacterium]
MPSIEDIIKSDVSKGVALGIGAALVAVAAIPVIVQASRPVARIAIKSGILLFEKGREAVAEAGETFEDLVAEVKAELAQEREAFVAGATSTAEAAENIAEAPEA